MRVDLAAQVRIINSATCSGKKWGVRNEGVCVSSESRISDHDLLHMHGLRMYLQTILVSFHRF